MQLTSSLILFPAALAASKVISPSPSPLATTLEVVDFTPTAAPVAVPTQTVGGLCDTATPCATERNTICVPWDFYTSYSECRAVSPCSTSCGYYARESSTRLAGAGPSDCDMHYCVLCTLFSCINCPDGHATITSFSGKCPSCYCAPTSTAPVGVHTSKPGSVVDTADAPLLTAPPIAI